MRYETYANPYWAKQEYVHTTLTKKSKFRLFILLLLCGPNMLPYISLSNLVAAERGGGGLAKTTKIIQGSFIVTIFFRGPMDLDPPQKKTNSNSSTTYIYPTSIYTVQSSVYNTRALSMKGAWLHKIQYS